MKILFIVLNQTGKGTYWRAHHLGRQLKLNGHKITLLATSRYNRFGIVTEDHDGLQLVEAPDLFSGALRSGWDPWNLLNRIQWMMDQDYELVHAFESRPTVIFPALYTAKRNNIPLVMDWSDWFGRGGLVEERPNPFIRAFLRPIETFFEEHYRPYADGTTVICTTLRERAIRLGVNPDSILLLPNGSNHENFQPLSMVLSRQQLGLPIDLPIIGFVGALSIRDAHLMADAFELLVQSNSEARLLIAGYCPVDLKKIVRSSNHVIQTGYLDQDELNSYLAACDLFWLPLRDTLANRGRFPLKLTDYMAIGRPVVATCVGDVPEIVEKYSIGLTCPPDAQDIHDATMRLMNDPGLRRDQGLRARRTAIEQFSWSRFAGDLEKYYQKIIHQRASTRGVKTAHV